MLIFSDASKMCHDPESIVCLGPYAFDQVFNFLIDPAALCSVQLDIIEVAALMERNTSHQTSFDMPNVDPKNCFCGECCSLQQRLEQNYQQNPEGFQMKYLAVVARSRQCDAFEKAWDPLLTKAELWVETFMYRVESPFDLFPYTSERRLGIAILDTICALDLEIGKHLDTRELLRFMTYLRIRHVYLAVRLHGNGTMRVCVCRTSKPR